MINCEDEEAVSSWTMYIYGKISAEENFCIQSENGHSWNNLHCSMLVDLTVFYQLIVAATVTFSK